MASKREDGGYLTAAHPLAEPTTAAMREARERNLEARRQLGFPEGKVNLAKLESSGSYATADDELYTPEDRLLAAVLAHDAHKRRLVEGPPALREEAGNPPRAEVPIGHERATRKGAVPVGSPEAAAIIARYRAEDKSLSAGRRKPPKRTTCGGCGMCMTCFRKLEREARQARKAPAKAA